MERNETYKPSPESFARFFAGESTAEETAKINHWIAESKENREEANHLKLIWSDIGSLRSEVPKVDVKAAFEKVKLKRVAQMPVTKPAFQTLWKVAAVLVLAASLLFIVLRSGEPESMQIIAHQISEVKLSDGSQITLNAGGELVYPESFTSTERRVRLLGEAFFDISRNPEKPFVIETDAVTITVLGTSFNVLLTDELVEVAVVTGQVEVKSTYGTEILTAGERITVDLIQQTAQAGKTSSSGAVQFWKSKKLMFDSSDMQQVIADLEKVYEVDIEVSTEEILQCKLNATFEEQSIEEVLEIIALTQELQLSQENGIFYLTGAGCNE
ncbi:MAG: FecR domain-containing protein [Marinoscillum sp.]